MSTSKKERYKKMFVITATAEIPTIAKSFEDAAVTVWEILQDWEEDYYTLESVNKRIQDAIDEEEDWAGWYVDRLEIRCYVKVKEA